MYDVVERLRRSITILFLILSISLLVAGGLWVARVAYANIPDSGGVIHACYDAGNGTLRVIDTEAGETCRPQETALSWNQEGPQGPEGPSGPEGPPGPSDGYVKSLRGGTGIEVNGTVNVLSLSLPAGDYILSTTALVQRNQAGISTVICDLRVGGGPFATGYVERLDGADAVATLAATSGVSLSTDEMIHLSCFASGADGTFVTLADLTAVRVGTVTRQ